MYHIEIIEYGIIYYVPFCLYDISCSKVLNPLVAVAQAASVQLSF